MNQGELIHTEDNFMFTISEGKTQAEIIEALKEAGYNMGRTSLSNLMAGKVEKSCGFIFTPTPAEDVLMVNGVDLTPKHVVVVGTVTQIEHNQTNISEMMVGVHDLHPTKPTVTPSRRKREGGYAGKASHYYSLKARHARAGKSGWSLRADRIIQRDDFPAKGLAFQIYQAYRTQN